MQQLMRTSALQVGYADYDQNAMEGGAAKPRGIKRRIRPWLSLCSLVDSSTLSTLRLASSPRGELLRNQSRYRWHYNERQARLARHTLHPDRSQKVSSRDCLL